MNEFKKQNKCKDEIMNQLNSIITNNSKLINKENISELMESLKKNVEARLNNMVKTLESSFQRIVTSSNKNMNLKVFEFLNKEKSQ
jgi:hypothetical protein